MPTDPSVDDCGSSFFYSFCQLNDFLKGGTVRDEIDHRKAINNDEFMAYGFANAAHDFNRQSHPVFIRAAPFICSFVGMGHKKLVQKISFRSHDFDAVIARLFCPSSTGGDIGDLFFDTFGVQLFRCEH